MGIEVADKNQEDYEDSIEALVDKIEADGVFLLPGETHADLIKRMGDALVQCGLAAQIHSLDKRNLERKLKLWREIGFGSLLISLGLGLALFLKLTGAW